jgi:hypothetical protein
MVFKWGDDTNTTGDRSIKQSRIFVECKSENYRNRNFRYKALEELAKQLNFPDLTEEDVNLKVK